jgi:rod shape-determining protein MreC
LELLSIHFYAGSTPYTQAKLLTASNAIVGGINSAFAGVVRYFGLESENQRLVARVAELEISSTPTALRSKSMSYTISSTLRI